MKKFTICIDFNDSIDGMKEELFNHLMDSSGFKKYIESDSGQKFYLPKFLYDYRGEIDKRNLVEKVQAIAGNISRDYKILITESKGRIWYNLDN